MIILAGYWELGYSSPLRESERWDYMCKDFGINEWHMIPVSGIYNTRLEENAALKEVFIQHPNIPAVFFDENATTVLSDFTHPQDVIYVFGKSGYSPLGLMREGDISIKIDTPASVGGLWADQAASIVLYDRLLKNN
jgi:hypothetical protein